MKLMLTSSLFLIGLQTLHPGTVSRITNPIQAISYAREAERDPLAPDAAKLRKEAIRFAKSNPNGIDVCEELLTKLGDSHKPNSIDIGYQAIISSAAYFFERRGNLIDRSNEKLAGVQAALNVYERFLAADPKSQVTYMDSLLKLRSKGDLEPYVRSHC
jgi:hypothetical protein